jgi:uracil-DNA glycosylase family 4
LTGDDAPLKNQMNSIPELKEKYAALLAEYSPVVLGEGKKGAEIFMIGEAPGKQEVEKGRPFVGQAGKNLDEFLEYLGIERTDVYITNAVKFRPVKKNPDTGRLSNRAPTAKEIELFRPLLMDEIDLIDPPVIVTLGNIPLASLTGRDIKIGDVHGGPSEYKGKMLYPLYHPASIIYRRGLKEVYLEDLTRLKSLLRKH